MKNLNNESNEVLKDALILDVEKVNNQYFKSKSNLIRNTKLVSYLICIGAIIFLTFPVIASFVAFTIFTVSGITALLIKKHDLKKLRKERKLIYDKIFDIEERITIDDDYMNKDLEVLFNHKSSHSFSDNVDNYVEEKKDETKRFVKRKNF